MRNISKQFNLPLGKGHSHYDFLDINLSKDNHLFIDALLCQCCNEKYSIEAHKTLDSYMVCVFEAIKSENIELQHYLFSEVGEVKETYLGMSRFSNQGKGSSHDILLPIFKRAMSVLGDITDISLIPIVSGNFDKDRMSDLISRLCLKVLYDFTLEQCKKHNILLSKEIYNVGYYWCYESKSWKMLKGNVLIYNNKPIILTPKNWVCSSSVLNAQSFLSVEWAAYRQSVHLQEKTGLAQYFTKEGKLDYKKPSKVDVKSNDLNGKVHKEVISAFIVTDIGKESLNEFFTRKYKNIIPDYQHLSNTELDNKIYKSDDCKFAM